MYEATNRTSKDPRSASCCRKSWKLIAKSVNMRVNDTACWDVGKGRSFRDEAPQPTNDVSSVVGSEVEARKILPVTSGFHLYYFLGEACKSSFHMLQNS